MNIYLVSNNLVLNDLNYETVAAVDEKRENRPLSIAGEKEALKLSKVLGPCDIYASTFASSLATAKYLANSYNLIININRNFNDVKIGNMGRHNIKMLRFMQDKNFDFKYAGGESLNEAQKRIHKAFIEVVKKGSDAVIFTHKRAMMALLLNYCELGYNLDERLILSYHDKVILDDTENNIDIIKIEIKNKKIINIDYLELER